MFEPVSTTAQLLPSLRELVQMLTVVVVCAGVMLLVYRHISSDEPDSNEFAGTVFILTVTIGLLVSIIKQAPAISFGLFGAMSIVRFRTPIKQPKRMIFVLMASTIGVCCGAGAYLATLVGTAVLSLISLMLFDARWQKGATRPSTEVRPANGAADDRRRWGISFVPLRLDGGQPVRVFAIVDEVSRQALATVAETYFSGSRVVAELERLAAEHGKPDIVISDSWPEFASKAVADWMTTTGTEWVYTQPGHSYSPPHIFAFARQLDDERWKGRRFSTVLEAQGDLESWRRNHNDRVGRAERTTADIRPSEQRPADGNGAFHMKAEGVKAVR